MADHLDQCSDSDHFGESRVVVSQNFSGEFLERRQFVLRNVRAFLFRKTIDEDRPGGSLVQNHGAKTT